MTTTDLIELRKMDDYGTVTSIGGMGGVTSGTIGYNGSSKPPIHSNDLDIC
jgi:hypothetical protein